MAPKKGGKAPAKKGGGDDDGPDPKEMSGILEAKLLSLRQRIVFEQTRSMKAQGNVTEFQESETDLEKSREEL